MLSEIVAAAEPKPTPEAEAITTAPVETAKPDAPTEPGDAPEPEQKLVPLAALHEERQNRKQLAAEVRQLREAQQQANALQQQRDQEWQIAQQRMAQVLARQQQPEVPSETDDPLGYTVHTVKQTAAQVEQMRQQEWQREQEKQRQQQEWQQRTQQEQQTNALVQLTTQSEAKFAEKTPDYQDAITYAKTRRVKELMAAGYTNEDAASFTQREGWQLAHQWLSQGRDPAQMGYQFAQAMGYTPKTVDPDVRAEMQEQGQRAAKASGGGAVKGRMSAAQVAALTPQQLARMPEEEFRAIMGG